MNRSLCLVFLSIGTVLIIYAVNASHSIASAFSRFMTGVPTDRTFWFLLGGIVAIAIGVGGLLRAPQRR